MKCTRCHGLMVEDHLLDVKESLGPMWIKTWRCVACGNIVDPLILKHRSAQTSQALRLVVVDARVDGGPMFKRMRPRARGMAHVVARRSSHISVTVE